MAAAGLNVPPGFVIRADVMASLVDAEALRACARESRLGGRPGLVGSCDRAESTSAGPTNGWGVRWRFARRPARRIPRRRASRGSRRRFSRSKGADDVCDRVVECWASFFSERALFYRSQKGSLEDLEMAVVVQTMIAAEKSGVLFTVDPVARRRDRLLVEAVFGLGEQVVSGEVTPDHYIVDRRGEVKTERLVHGGVLTPDELGRSSRRGRPGRALRQGPGHRVGDRRRDALPPPVTAGDDAVIDRATRWIEPYWNAEHLRRTADWLLVLDPDAAEALRLAALTHDMERHFPGGPEQDLSISPAADTEYRRQHSERSARIVSEWLREEGAEPRPSPRWSG